MSAGPDKVIHRSLTGSKHAVYSAGRMSTTIFDKLVSHFGDQQKVADAFNVSPQVVSNWKRRGLLPADMALPIETRTRGFITAKEVLEERARRAA